MNAPKYDIGTDIIIRRGELPDKIHICNIYMKEQSVEWMYNVMSAQSGSYEYMSEHIIDDIISKQIRPVYDIPYVKYLCNHGFIWYKNVNDIHNVVDKLTDIKEISQILVSKIAFYPDGTVAKGKCGIWIKY